jgi:phthalate 4,5-dioxygenase oxygenase subunit
VLTHEENELLCRVGPGTPMGNLVRRFWIPAASSADFVPGGAPKRVRLAGQDYVLFRDSAGRIGLLDELCPHRGASLTLARNEECGLRCIYHGWKIGHDGAVLETPTEPADSTFKDRVHARAYPAYDAGGLVWVYLGPPALEPARMNFDFTDLPEAQRVVLQLRIACNFMQPIEGVIDSAHSNFLHADTFKPTANIAQSLLLDDLTVQRPSNDTRPKADLLNTDYGLRYAALRRPIVDPETQQYVRVTEFIAPFYAMFPAPKGYGNTQAFVPIDDEHTMLYFIKYRHDDRPIDADERRLHYEWSKTVPGRDVDEDYRSKRTRDNGWLQDRAAMERGTSFSGIQGVQIEDAVVQESMGPIFDRTQEHLGASDVAVIRMRRLMIDAARALAERGEAPFAVDRRNDYSDIQALERIIPRADNWQGLYAPQQREEVAH